MAANYQFEKFGFVWSWLLVNILGTLAGGLAILGLNIAFEEFWALPARWMGNHSFDYHQLAALAGGLLVGNLLIGWGEQWVIRRHTQSTMPWFRASAIGAGIGAMFWVLTYLSSLFINSQLLNWLDAVYLMLWLDGFILLFGLCIGYLQWRSMRKTVPNSDGWISIRILSSFGFIAVAYWTPLMALIIALLATDSRNHIFDVITFSANTNKINLYIALIFALIPELASALIRGLFLKNRLKKSAEDFGKGIEEIVPEIPTIGGFGNPPYRRP